MSVENIIINSISKNLDFSVENIFPLGKGASGSVYRVICNNGTKEIAVKISRHSELMQQEFEMLAFLKNNTSSKIPDVYFFDKAEEAAIIAMEYINGISGTDKAIKFSFKKKHLAESIVNNLLVIQQTKNDKFGPYNNAVYDTWQEYYKTFADEIYEFSLHKHSENELDATVMKAVKLSFENFDKIFCEKISPPTLIHGDYWLPNFIVDKKTMDLLSVVDPFNVIWADPEYELFAMSVGYGKKLRLYEIYKNKVNVSKHCDVKLEMYALYSELLWYKKLGKVTHSYLKFRAKRLLKEMKKYRII